MLEKAYVNVIFFFFFYLNVAYQIKVRHSMQKKVMTRTRQTQTSWSKNQAVQGYHI